MPPKTRTNKAVKAFKENAYPSKSNKLQNGAKEKRSRKPLADKTNSASDDNASVLTSEKLPAKGASVIQDHRKVADNDVRPRRARRLPNRYKENNVLKNLSNNDIPSPNQDSLESNKANVDKIELTPVKKLSGQVKKLPVVVMSPLKCPVKKKQQNEEHNNSIIKKRPKRICRLPSKFDNHSISPNKYVPLQPINASTPISNKTTKNTNTKVVQKKLSSKNTPSPVTTTKEIASKQKTLKDFFNNSSVSDTNNNARGKKQKLPQYTTKISPAKSKQLSQKTTKSNSSFRVLEENNKSRKRDSEKLDIYEFTYDPDEEPPPAKKKKKRTVTKKQTKPKTVKIKSNYDKNLAKALAALKNTVSTNPFIIHQENSKNITHSNTKPAINKNVPNTVKEITGNENASIVHEKNYNSVRVEDIAMDMQADDIGIDYSPVNSPNRQATPLQNEHPKSNVANNPLNLQDELSFFDDQPAASSSMNVSVRHPLASPWRVEFGNLPIKWQANTYVKPNMTPAVESSFINMNDSKKKHVYTNIVAEAVDTLPEVLSSTPNFKQTSIMSFIREVIDKNESRKSKTKSTPVKANSLFEDISNTSIVTTKKKQTTLITNSKTITPEKHVTSESNGSDNISEVHNSENLENELENSTPKDKDKADKNVTYFGFDSEDQENISPKKKNNKARSLRTRTRGILQELNTQKGPMRAVLPVSVKSKPIQSDVNKIFDGMKSATEPPVFPEVVKSNTQITNVIEAPLLENEANDDSESVHLFEDIECIYHQKPNRKSYGKPKKVMFNKPNTADSNSSPLSDTEQGSGDEDLDDLSFKLPTEKLKKTIKRKKPNKLKLSKKEEKEVEAWAAGFNSMCEDIDDFDLVVE